MAFGLRSKSTKLKITFTAAIILLLSLVIIFYIGYRHQKDIPDRLLSMIQDDSNISIGTKNANIAIGKVDQISWREGRKDWHLFAEKAYVIHDKQRVMIEEVTVIFYTKNEKEVKLTADKGYINTSSKDIEVNGNVVIKNDIYRLNTNRLHYLHHNRLLYSKELVIISNETSNLVADSMVYEIEKNKATFKGNIEGIFIGNTIS